MYFISRIFQTVKFGMAVIGTLLGASVIVYGAIMSGGVLYIVGGSFYLVTSIFLLYDSSKVIRDIRQQIDRLKNEIYDFATQNKKLAGHVNQLELVKQGFILENRKLHTNLEQSHQQLEKLEKLKQDYLVTAEALKEHLHLEQGQIQQLSDKNLQLSEKLDKIDQMKNAIQLENAKLQKLLIENQTQVENLASIKDQYLGENNRLQNEIKDLEISNHELKDQTAYLEQQVEKLRKLYADTKQLMLNLAEAGDVFNHFSTQIDSSVIRLDQTGDDLDQTSQMLAALVDKLKEQKFSELDQNQDGVVDQMEFDAALKR